MAKANQKKKVKKKAKKKEGVGVSAVKLQKALTERAKRQKEMLNW